MTEDQLPAGFMVIHSNQPELLRQLMVNWMKSHPLHPLEDEIILVQSNGIAQWLKQALAADESTTLTSGCGIAAALQALLPSRFVWQAYRAVLDNSSVPDISPFDKPQLLWRLMRLLPLLAQEPDYEPLARFLQHDNDLRKRYQLAERLADLFDQYQVYRADWLAAWGQGQNVLQDYHGNRTHLSETFVWQPKLWRALLKDVGEHSNTSRAAVHQRFLDAVREIDHRPAGLARRVIVFGLSSLPKQSLEVLRAISRWTQVVLCINNPCEHYWVNILTEKDYFRHQQGRHNPKVGLPKTLQEDDLHLHAHPLLAAWGKQGRDYIALLDEMDEPSHYQHLFADSGQRIDLFESHGIDCLLNQLQDDIRDLSPVAESRSKWSPIHPQHDHSIRFHITHSLQREVEVLHDQLLAAFNADASLKPREIIVMVPDINLFAPSIQAVFGQINASDDRYIPYTIADLGKRHQTPLLYALEYLLNITEARLATSEILDLLDVPAVRKRFGIEEAELLLLQQWITQANIRWGLNNQHRQKLGISFDYDQNTWLFGLKRMLLGYAVGSDPTERSELDWHGIEPYGDVAGLDAALVGPLAHLLTQIESVINTFAQPASPVEWGERLRSLLLDFFESSENDEAYLLLQLQTSLDKWLNACDNARLTEPLSVSVVREFWLAQIDQESLSQRFFAGNLTFATLMPMRAIPFRRIYLLGMNDGEYPRTHAAMDFDLMVNDYRPGDRSRREDDRYLFLEALLSAREHLHISWVGRSIHDNTERPPSVLVSQFRDHLAACWQLHEALEEDNNLLDALTIEHPLQAFSNDYFTDTPAHANLFTYAREWQLQATDTSPLIAVGLAAPTFDAPIGLNQLMTFLNDPVKAFFRERLRVFYEVNDFASEDQEPFAIDALRQWSIQDALIQSQLDAKQHDRPEAEAVQRQLNRIARQGLLPVGGLAQLLQLEFIEPLEQIFTLFDKANATWPLRQDDEWIEFEQTINGQTLKIQGQLTQIFANSAGERCRIELNSSNLIKDNQYRHDKLLPVWVQHLAGHLNGQPLRTHLIGKNGAVTLHPLEPQVAKQQFIDLIDAYVAGLCAPLPIAPVTSLAWLINNGEESIDTAPPLSKASDKARTAYEGSYNRTGEVENNRYLQRQYPTFTTLWSQGAFTHWAKRLLQPLVENVKRPNSAENNS